MNPPFSGVKIITKIDLAEIYRLIDTRQLFAGRWQFKKTEKSEEAYQKLLRQKAWPALADWKKRCSDEGILEPKIAYGYFSNVALSAFTPSPSPLPQGERVIMTFVPLQLVTIGPKVVQKCQWLFATHKYTDYLYLHGLAASAAEALAEYSHRNILRELDIPFDVDKKLPAGSRISPGYPAWKDLSAQKEICKLLASEKIGVSVTENFQLVPEYSTSAMITIP